MIEFSSDLKDSFYKSLKPYSLQQLYLAAIVQAFASYEYDRCIKCTLVNTILLKIKIKEKYYLFKRNKQFYFKIKKY